MDDGDDSNQSVDEAAVRELFRALLDDWGRGDGNAYASRFTDDADYVSFDGTHTKGRHAIASSHQKLFDSYLQGTRLTGEIAQLRFLAPDVALVLARGSTIMRGKTKPSPERESIQTLVAVRHDGQWRFAAFHNVRVRPIGRGFAAFLIWSLTDFGWRALAARQRRR